MSTRLQRELGKAMPFGDKAQEAFLEIQRTADVLQADMAEVFKPSDLSPTQYNVLRILAGAGCAMGCRQIAERMIKRDPDMTRLLERLERRGLITRSRDDRDRRVVHTRITEKGQRAIAGLSDAVIAAHHRQLGHLGEQKLQQLIDLLEEARAPLGRESADYS